MQRAATFLREHSLTLILLAIGAAAFALFTWGEYGYFCDQARTHHETCTGFWSPEHLHDWAYNASSNWQSEVLFGAVLIYVLKARGARERGDE
jgi:hypothetical protein